MREEAIKIKGTRTEFIEERTRSFGINPAKGGSPPKEIIIGIRSL